MKLPVLTTLQGYKKENLPKDLLSGVVIAAVSIPISMGYAQIAGLPAVYGLYGSVLPVLLFALFSTSPQFIFGVDAAPAAMVGAVLSSLGVALGSGEAVALVPVLTFYTALWLLLFAALRAGKVLNFISTPVMGGFISGICCTIILMQTPKLLGGTAGTGELPELTRHLIAACGEIHWLSLALGLAALGILLAGKRLFPKFPMAIAIMALGAVCSVALDLPTRGVATLAAVEPGLPPLRLPDLRLLSPAQALGSTLPVAVVIMAETLLAENSFALRGDYTLRDNREILTFSLSNFAACLVGCCPVNGSVSRSSMNEQYGGRTQAVSLIAAAVMSCMLLQDCGLWSGPMPRPEEELRRQTQEFEWPTATRRRSAWNSSPPRRCRRWSIRRVPTALSNSSTSSAAAAGMARSTATPSFPTLKSTSRSWPSSSPVRRGASCRSSTGSAHTCPRRCAASIRSWPSGWPSTARNCAVICTRATPSSPTTSKTSGKNTKTTKTKKEDACIASILFSVSRSSRLGGRE